MKNKYIKRLSYFILLTALSIIMISSYSCNNEEYRLFTFKRGVHFSFAYPSSYYVDSIYTYVKAKSVGGIDLIDKTSHGGIPDGYGGIGVAEAGNKYLPSAKEVIEEKASSSSVIEILERSPIEVDGISADMLVYSHKTGTIVEKSPEYYNVLRISRIVCFDHNGLVWEVDIDSFDFKADQAKVDFDHMLQTFKILN